MKYDVSRVVYRIRLLKNYEGHPINELQKWHHSVNLQNMKNPRRTFCSEFFLGYQLLSFIMMTSSNTVIAVFFKRYSFTAL